MKNIFKSFIITLSSLALVAVACDNAPGEDSNNEFPQKKEYNVTPGSTLELTFNTTQAWELTVPENSIQWFWIQDGSFKLYRLKGKSGNQVVTIGVSPVEELETDRTCEVTLKIGGKSQVIATLVRSSKEKVLTLYSAVVSEGEIQFQPDGSGYLYGESEAENLELVWTGSDFRLPVKIDANYNWTVQTPKWITIDVPEKGIGETALNIFGTPSEYPLEPSQGKIQFMFRDEVVKEYPVSIPGCKDIFSYRMNMNLTELEFNHKGQYKVATGFIEGPATGVIYGASGTRVIAVTKDGETYSPEAPSWLTIEVDAYDTAEGAEVLQERNFTVSASVNEGDNRYAALFMLPHSVTVSASELFDESGVKEEYQEYMLPVTQLSSDQEYVSVLSRQSAMALAGAAFKVSQDESLKTLFGETRYIYELVYNNEYARDEARMIFTSPAASYKIFDESLQEVTSAEEYFMSFEMDEDKMGGVVDMFSESIMMGYVVFYGASDNVLAVIKCTFNPEEVIEPIADVRFIGDSEMYAPMVGATLEDVTKDPNYAHYKDGNNQVFHLRYTMPNMPMTISIPTDVVKHTVNPYNLRHNFRVNETKYDETFVNGILGGVALIDGGVTIYMLPDEGMDYMRGNIVFNDASDATVIVLVCTYDVRDSEE